MSSAMVSNSQNNQTFNKETSDTNLRLTFNFVYERVRRATRIFLGGDVRRDRFGWSRVAGTRLILHIQIFDGQ